MHDADFEAQQFRFTDERSKYSKTPAAGATWPLRPAFFLFLSSGDLKFLYNKMSIQLSINGYSADQVFRKQ